MCGISDFGFLELRRNWDLNILKVRQSGHTGGSNTRSRTLNGVKVQLFFQGQTKVKKSDNELCCNDVSTTLMSEKIGE